MPFLFSFCPQPSRSRARTGRPRHWGNATLIHFYHCTNQPHFHFLPAAEQLKGKDLTVQVLGWEVKPKEVAMFVTGSLLVKAAFGI